jgi:hypothetical protein
MLPLHTVCLISNLETEIKNLRRKSTDNTGFLAEIYMHPLRSEKFFENVRNV